MMVSERLSVYLHNSLAGQLWLDDTSRFSFQYDPGYIEDPGAIPLSLSLPLNKEPYINDTARPFFSNLLPEGEVRSLVAKIKQISEHNDFKLLEAIGGECAGAVSIVPEYTSLSTESDYIALSEQEVEDIIDENAIRPVLILKDELRLSLAGAQNKIPVYRITMITEQNKSYNFIFITFFSFRIEQLIHVSDEQQPNNTMERHETHQKEMWREKKYDDDDC